jgi:hypothetical protein
MEFLKDEAHRNPQILELKFPTAATHPVANPYNPRYLRGQPGKQDPISKLTKRKKGLKV